VALTLRNPTEAEVFEQEQRRQRQDFDRRPSTPRAPENSSKKQEYEMSKRAGKRARKKHWCKFRAF